MASASNPDRPNGQDSLFDKGEWWDEHWQGMPEFVSEDLEPFKSIYVHFESPEDMRRFSELVGQKITTETKCIWFPEAEIGSYRHKRYIAAPILYKDKQRPDES